MRIGDLAAVHLDLIGSPILRRYIYLLRLLVLHLILVRIEVVLVGQDKLQLLRHFLLEYLAFDRQVLFALLLCHLRVIFGVIWVLNFKLINFSIDQVRLHAQVVIRVYLIARARLLLYHLDGAVMILLKIIVGARRIRVLEPEQLWFYRYVRQAEI